MYMYRSYMYMYMYSNALCMFAVMHVLHEYICAMYCSFRKIYRYSVRTLYGSIYNVHVRRRLKLEFAFCKFVA